MTPSQKAEAEAVGKSDSRLGWGGGGHRTLPGSDSDGEYLPVCPSQVCWWTGLSASRLTLRSHCSQAQHGPKHRTGLERLRALSWPQPHWAPIPAWTGTELLAKDNIQPSWHQLAKEPRTKEESYIPEKSPTERIWWGWMHYSNT